MIKRNVLYPTTLINEDKKLIHWKFKENIKLQVHHTKRKMYDIHKMHKVHRDVLFNKIKKKL